MVRTVDHPEAGEVELTGVPLKMSESPGDVEDPPPTLGEDTREILMDRLGYDREDLTGLAANGVIDPDDLDN
jgi:crotonobetainyl-CoA:carnitine CoA-transferase CaiB-like acyl-CoA transferase